MGSEFEAGLDSAEIEHEETDYPHEKVIQRDLLKSKYKNDEKVNKDKKKTNRGIVYLSCIPQSMSVKRLREEMNKYGETGNIFLQPDGKASFHRHKQFFTEGWVEFHDKLVAKQVATLLNNTQVGGKKKHPWMADIWNIKYLPKFQWAHLNERLAYERAVHDQRLRAEIPQIKRESQFHKENFQKSQKIKDMAKCKYKKEDSLEETPSYTIKQRETEEEILAKKCKLETSFKNGQQKRTKQRKKKSSCRPDDSHSVGALSLAANKLLLHKLFGRRS